jgi:ubiquinone/menaquinone biosynthesis C-methylase UbiE
MIEMARQLCGLCHNIHFEEASADALPFETGYFDVVICTFSFHHYFNPGKSVREMQRVLVPGGRLLLLDATADNIFVRLFDKLASSDDGHVKLYSTAEFRALFSEAGLKYVRSKSIWHVPGLTIHVGERSLT